MTKRDDDEIGGGGDGDEGFLGGLLPRKAFQTKPLFFDGVGATIVDDDTKVGS